MIIKLLRQYLKELVHSLAVGIFGWIKVVRLRTRNIRYQQALREAIALTEQKRLKHYVIQESETSFVVMSRHDLAKYKDRHIIKRNIRDIDMQRLSTTVFLGKNGRAIVQKPTKGDTVIE